MLCALRALPGAIIDGHLTRPAPGQADRECAIRHRHSALDDFGMRPVLTPGLDAYHGGESDVAAATGTVHSQDLRKISGLAIDRKTWQRIDAFDLEVACPRRRRSRPGRGCQPGQISWRPPTVPWRSSARGGRGSVWRPELTNCGFDTAPLHSDRTVTAAGHDKGIADADMAPATPLHLPCQPPPPLP